MNDLNNFLQQSSYKPTVAIIVYRNGHSEWSDQAFYLESHDFSDTGQLLAGKPLKAETIAGMVNVFKAEHEQETRVGGIMPANVVFFSPGTGGDYTLVWHRPASQRVMYFTDNLKLKDGKAFVPPTLFIARGSNLQVYALGNNRRPGLSSKIYAAPFHNVNTEGRVCLGSAKAKVPKQKSFSNLIEYWEELFWGSKFSSVHNSKAVPTGMDKVWRSQLRRPGNPFPLTKLAAPVSTLESTLNKLLNGRR